MLAIRPPVDALAWPFGSLVIEPGACEHHGLKPWSTQREYSRYGSVCAVEFRKGAVEKPRLESPPAQSFELERPISTAEQLPLLELRWPQSKSG